MAGLNRRAGYATAPMFMQFTATSQFRVSTGQKTQLTG